MYAKECKIMDKNNSRFVSIGEAAKYLGVSRDTLRRWEKRGKLTPLRSPTNRRYYTKTQLDEALSGKVKTITPQKKKARLKFSRIQKFTIITGLSFIITVILGLVLKFFLLR